MGVVADRLEKGETVDDHGVIRLRAGRRWHEGFMVITDLRFIFVPDDRNHILSVLFAGVQDHRAFNKIVTADLFIDIDRRRLRFNGGKTFVGLCNRQLTRHAGTDGNPAALKAMRVRALQNQYAHVNAQVTPLLAEAQLMGQIKAELAELGAEPDEELNQQIRREKGVPDTPFDAGS